MTWVPDAVLGIVFLCTSPLHGRWDGACVHVGPRAALERTTLVMYDLFVGLMVRGRCTDGFTHPVCPGMPTQPQE